MKLPALLLLSAAATHAGPRASTNYSIAAETLDAGGGRATSAAYTNDGSVGGIGGISSVTTPAETVKHGYIGQLYDVTGLVLSASPTTINEGGTLPLSAVQILDDASTLAVPATSVAWSVVAGPLTSIDAAGLATAGIVYQDTSATARGTQGVFTDTLDLTVQNGLPDNFGSYAGDGLDDSWQFQYFGLDNPLAAPTQDPDGDGQDNRFEHTAGIIPNDPLSRFLLHIEDVPGEPTHKELKFSPTFPDRNYAVKSNTSLTGGVWENLTDLTDDNQQPERTVTDRAAGEPAKFYKVEITKP